MHPAKMFLNAQNVLSQGNQIGPNAQQLYATPAMGSPFSAMSPTSSPVSPQSIFDAIPSRNNQWVNTVMETAPFLDEQGIFQALGILDEALTSVRHRKAIDALMANANQANQAQVGMQAQGGMMNFGAAESMRQQVQTEQMMLLQRLQLLHNKYPDLGGQVNSFGMRGVPAAPGLNMPPEGPDGSSFNFMPMMGAQQRTDTACKALSDAMGQQAACQAQQELLNALSREIEQIKQVMAFAETTLPEPVLQAQEPSSRLKVAFDMGADYKNDKTWKVPRQANTVQTLSTSLQLLSKEDPDKLIIVRRINKLGFKASRKLKQYFGEFGSVIRVLIAHSTCRDLKDSEGKVRQRPSSLGFVQMASAEAVRKALALGTEQEVEGATILVQKFERQANAKGDLSPAEAAASIPDVKSGEAFWRQDTTKSNASTAETSSATTESDS